MKKLSFYIGIFLSLTILILILINPDICKKGALTGLLICCNIIIPSIFPFSVFVLLLLKADFLSKFKFLNKPCLKIFGFSLNEFSCFLLSLIGGYPLGAKLLNQAVLLKKTEKSTATVMLNYCVNAGPAFIILAVGSGILNSKKLGIILFFSHILASFILALLSKKRIKSKHYIPQKTELNIIDSFVLSVSESANATISICSFIVVFSVILSYINFYSLKFPILKNLSYLLEVTNAVTQNKNVLLISFLLGFSGFCVWFQTISQVKTFKINHLLFIIFRILHGFLSCSLTFLLLKIFKINTPTLSNGIGAFYNFSNSSVSASLSLIIMSIIFIISLYTKNFTSNLLEDLV